MCKNRKKSGFLHCGCSKAKVEAKVKRTLQPQPQPQPSTSTEKETKDEAQKYANPEVPAHNKLYIGTILLFGALIFNQSKKDNETT